MLKCLDCLNLKTYIVKLTKYYLKNVFVTDTLRDIQWNVYTMTYTISQRK